MMVTITLQYVGCDCGDLGILDVWNLNAPSIAAVQHLVDEELGPALRRHGRRCALEHGADPAAYMPEGLIIEVTESPIYSLREICHELADDRGTPKLSSRHLNQCRRPPAMITSVPVTLAAVLTKHGIRGANGKAQAYRPKPKPREQTWADSDEPPF